MTAAMSLHLMPDCLSSDSSAGSKNDLPASIRTVFDHLMACILDSDSLKVKTSGTACWAEACSAAVVSARAAATFRMDLARAWARVCMICLAVILGVNSVHFTK